jgi:EmrB/QacA subfamily drug resistance transporter
VTAEAPNRRSPRGILASMCLAVVLVVASVSALNLALTSIAVNLHASDSDLTWIADAYTVALAALVLPLGSIGDRIGRRNVLIAGTVVFGAASLASAFATSASTLIAMRAVMGVGAAMIMPGTLSTITVSLPANQLSRGVAIWAGCASAGAIIGLLVAGVLMQISDWQSIFVASAIVAAIAGVSAAVLAPNTHEQGHRPVDVVGASTLAVAIGALVYGIIEGGDIGWTQPRTLIAFAAAIVLLAAWCLSSLRHPRPMLDPRLYLFGGFRSGSAVVMVQFMAVFGFFFVGLQYMQIVLGYSALKSAVALVPIAVVILPASIASPRLTARFGLKLVLASGLLLLAVALAVLALMTVASGYKVLLPALLIAGLGFGIASSSATNAVVASLPRDRQGIASAVNDANREIGSAIGIALVGSLFTSGYQHHITALPAKLPATAAAAVKSSAAAGIEVADRLGAGGQPLTGLVRDAFMHGFSIAMWAIAAIALVVAVVVAIRAPMKIEAQPDSASG